MLSPTGIFLSFPFFLVLLDIVAGQYGHYDYGRDIKHLFRKREFSRTNIIGSLPAVNGLFPLRREVRDLQKDPEQWILYILALDAMQWADQTDNLSWYKLMGIHGAPFQDYGGAPAIDGHENEGYCTHVSNLFPVWHRPYMAFFEQTLYHVVQSIASMYPADQRDRFQKAAQIFRVPYWEWAAEPADGDSVLPLSIGGMPNIQAEGPAGVQNIANPLFSYTFHPLNTTGFPEYPFYLWNETKRAPARPITSSSISNNSNVARTFDAHVSSYQQRLYNLFSNYPDYTTWSNEGWIPTNNNGTYDSIESLHDSIHLAVGGTYGHMAIIAYSSFDPIFMLHHTNVDRIFAMWQILHPDSWVTPLPALLPTRTISVGDIQDSQSDLTPFFANETHFWNPDMVRNHTTFGYDYAETASGKVTDVMAAINRLYTTHSPAKMYASRKRNQVDQGGSSSMEINQGNSKIFGDTGAKDLTRDNPSSGNTPMELVVKNGSYYEWITNIKANKHAMKGSFNIHFFLGDVSDDSTSWEFADNLVGTLGVFANNLKRFSARDALITGTVPLTAALIKSMSDGNIQNLDPEHVEPFLKENLQYRLVMSSGPVLEADQVGGLSISVVSSHVRVPQHNEELASWGGFETHFDLYTS